jgi:hypothetical protein
VFGLDDLDPGIPTRIHAYKADVYSFAMFRFEILSGEEPFEGHKGFDFLIVKSGIPP